MAEIKIEGTQIINMTEKTELDGNESFAIQDAEGNKRVTSSNLAKYVSGNMQSELGETDDVII